MKKAIYAFSGDPITYGHIDIIERAASNFDKLIVAIGSNPDKHYMFSLSKRTELAKNALKLIKNVEVVSFEGLLVDYAYENNLPVIIRGVRNSADFDYERMLHQVGDSQKLGIDTLVLFSDPSLSHVSSSVVKAVVKEQGFIHEYVPPEVKQLLEAEVNKQFIVGITGAIGCGKSYVSDLIVSMGDPGYCHNIDLDAIGHHILEDLTEPRYRNIRKNLIKEFGPDIAVKNGRINRKALGQKVFGNPLHLATLNNLMLTPILVRLKRELYGKKGLVLLNGALIAEAGMLKLCNNKVVLVTCDKDTQRNRLIDRGLSTAQISHRITSQYSAEEKKVQITRSIDKDGYGTLWEIDNSGPGAAETQKSPLKEALHSFLKETRWLRAI